MVQGWVPSVDVSEVWGQMHMFQAFSHHGHIDVCCGIQMDHHQYSEAKAHCMFYIAH